jgi:preprotein translocase subunit SecD
MAVITVPRPLREKLGEEGTDALVALINEAGENNRQSVIEVAEERFEQRLAEEMSKVREEMSKLRVELSGEMSKLRVELSGETSKLRVELSGETSKLRAEMHDLRANLVQWMFLFWIGQIGVLTGILFAFFRK